MNKYLYFLLALFFFLFWSTMVTKS